MRWAFLMKQEYCPGGSLVSWNLAWPHSPWDDQGTSGYFFGFWVNGPTGTISENLRNSFHLRGVRVTGETGITGVIGVTGVIWVTGVTGDTPLIVYIVAICPRGNQPYIQITSIVLPYSQSTNYLLGTFLSWRKSTLLGKTFLSSEPSVALIWYTSDTLPF